MGIYNFSKPANVTKSGIYNPTIANSTTVSQYRIEICDDFCFIGKKDGLVIADLAIPTNPVDLVYINMSGNYNISSNTITDLAVDKENKILYVKSLGALLMYNFREILEPELVGAFLSTSTIDHSGGLLPLIEIETAENLLFLNLGMNGLTVVHYNGIPFSLAYRIFLVRTFLAATIPVLFLGSLLVYFLVSKKSSKNGS